MPQKAISKGRQQCSSKKAELKDWLKRLAEKAGLKAISKGHSKDIETGIMLLENQVAL